MNTFQEGQSVTINSDVLGPVAMKATYARPYTAPGAFPDEHVIILPNRHPASAEVALRASEFQAA